MKVRPITLKQANEFVSQWHRHHRPVQGCKWAIGAEQQDALVGVAIAGRPVARLLDNGTVCEVTRLCTDGTKNACSMLYSACARIAKAMGYAKIITYILQSEPGTSLIATGWACEGAAGGGTWDRPNRDREDKHPTEGKQRWSRLL